MKDEMVRVHVLIGKEQRRRLFHVLLDEGISFGAWARRQIDAKLAEQKSKDWAAPFAPGMLVNMEASEKLSRPSFDRFSARVKSRRTLPTRKADKAKGRKQKIRGKEAR